ncbi:MAG: Gfo/Idh/MocA family oxidoreductase, partial [Candidatus Omnitrophica bacterium]|nr:Gfo/Idh/MocA family oxidoreductase [Candidatus Omnitrophota bacterium]
MSENTSRRDFIKTGAVTAAGVMTAASASRVYGANEKIRLGFVGVANRGGQIFRAALKSDDTEVVALCDVDDNPIPKRMKDLEEKGRSTEVDVYKDYRKILERDDIDAVVSATPDHWHALITTHSCQAGKDIYIEKPLSMTIREGRRMIEVANETNRVVQVGTHRRSSTIYPRIREIVQNGDIGKVVFARCYRLSNMTPNGIGNDPDSDPPTTLDWNMWLGPREYRPFNKTIHPYKFRWWKHYSSQIGNWGVHYFDLIRWMTGEVYPSSISAHGGQYAVKDNRTIPDTMEATFEFASGMIVTFGQYEAAGNSAMREGEIELRGTKGTLYANPRFYRVYPEKGGQFQDSSPKMEPMEEKVESEDMDYLHMRNFLDCVKSRKQPNAPLEEGHRSTSMSLLANIALETRSRIEWDGEKEEIL